MLMARTADVRSLYHRVAQALRASPEASIYLEHGTHLSHLRVCLLPACVPPNRLFAHVPCFALWPSYFLFLPHLPCAGCVVRAGRNV